MKSVPRSSGSQPARRPDRIIWRMRAGVISVPCSTQLTSRRPGEFAPSTTIASPGSSLVATIRRYWMPSIAITRVPFFLSVIACSRASSSEAPFAPLGAGGWKICAGVCDGAGETLPKVSTVDTK